MAESRRIEYVMDPVGCIFFIRIALYESPLVRLPDIIAYHPAGFLTDRNTVGDLKIFRLDGIRAERCADAVAFDCLNEIIAE